MGFDLERFMVAIDEELKCPVCCGVLEEGVQSKNCEHAFCRKCIVEWIKNSETCPVDRTPLESSQLQPIPRIIRNLLNHLQLKCDFHYSGCTQLVTLEELALHRETCEYNPECPVACPKECGAYVPRNILDKHDCVRDLRTLLCNQQKEINELKNSITGLVNLAEEQRHMSARNKTSLSTLIDKYDNLTKSIQGLEAPIKEVLLLASRNQNGENSNSVSSHIKTTLAQETTTEVYVSNVDRGVTPLGLKEYLLRRDVNVLSCKEALKRGWKNDFRIVVFKSEVSKVLQSELWPRGISCFICGEYYTTKTEGSLDPDDNDNLPSLKACVPPWMT